VHTTLGPGLYKQVVRYRECLSMISLLTLHRADRAQSVCKQTVCLSDSGRVRHCSDKQDGVLSKHRLVVIVSLPI